MSKQAKAPKRTGGAAGPTHPAPDPHDKEKPVSVQPHRPHAAEVGGTAPDSILAEAEGMVIFRDIAYGDPRQSFARVARIWSVVLGTDVTPAQVGLCMVGLKLAREARNHARDNLVDVAGYVRCLDLILGDGAAGDAKPNCGGKAAPCPDLEAGEPLAPGKSPAGIVGT